MSDIVRRRNLFSKVIASLPSWMFRVVISTERGYRCNSNGNTVHGPQPSYILYLSGVFDANAAAYIDSPVNIYCGCSSFDLGVICRREEASDGK